MNFHSHIVCTFFTIIIISNISKRIQDISGSLCHRGCWFLLLFRDRSTFLLLAGVYPHTYLGVHVSFILARVVHS